MPEIALSKNTLVTVGAAFAVAVPIFTIGMWANSKLESIDRRLERIELTSVEVMNKAAFESWSLRLARDNATLKVPEFHQ